jgi:sigma-E factor negative regulatory protein RseA
MDTHKKIREHISALSDGELPASDLELAFAALQGADGQGAWNTYFRIGDELRAQATPALSDQFGARLAARLAAEPAHGKKAEAPGQAQQVQPPAAAKGADATPATQPHKKSAIVGAS